MAPKTPTPPHDLGRAGRDLWRRVLTAYELDPHEMPGWINHTAQPPEHWVDDAAMWRR